MTEEVRCLVIGAGPSGLVCARYLRPVMTVTVVDCKASIGGQWHDCALTDDSTPSSDLFKSLYGHQQASMYGGMRVNIPIEITHTEDFLPESQTHQSYPPKEEVMRYLQRYVDHFALKPLIRLNTAAVRVEINADQTFTATLREATGQERKEVYEKVVIANGHYSVPSTPPIEGQETFPGRIWHSHNFRQIPEHKYQDQRILLIGGGSSSWDILKIALETCPHISQIVISARRSRLSFFSSITDPQFLELADSGKIRVVGETVRIEGRKALFSSGEWGEVDEIVLCTGYRFSFPFLPEIEVSEGGNYVKDFYKGVFWLKNPSLAMIGAHRGVLFLKLELVAKWLARDFLRTPDLPGWRDSLQRDESRLLSEGKPLSALYACIDLPSATEAFFADIGLDYDRTYAEKCNRLFLISRKNLLSHFFSYKTFVLES